MWGARGRDPRVSSKRKARRKVRRRGLHKRAEAEALPLMQRGKYAATEAKQAKIYSWPPAWTRR